MPRPGWTRTRRSRTGLRRRRSRAGGRRRSSTRVRCGAAGAGEVPESRGGDAGPGAVGAANAGGGRGCGRRAHLQGRGMHGPRRVAPRGQGDARAGHRAGRRRTRHARGPRGVVEGDHPGSASWRVCRTWQPATSRAACRQRRFARRSSPSRRAPIAWKSTARCHWSIASLPSCTAGNAPTHRRTSTFKGGSSCCSGRSS